MTKAEKELESKLSDLQEALDDAYKTLGGAYTPETNRQQAIEAISDAMATLEPFVTEDEDDGEEETEESDDGESDDDGDES